MTLFHSKNHHPWRLVITKPKIFVTQLGSGGEVSCWDAAEFNTFQPLSSPGTLRVILIDVGDILEFLHVTNIWTTCYCIPSYRVITWLWVSLFRVELVSAMTSKLTEECERMHLQESYYSSFFITWAETGDSHMKLKGKEMNTVGEGVKIFNSRERTVTYNLFLIL